MSKIASKVREVKVEGGVLSVSWFPFFDCWGVYEGQVLRRLLLTKQEAEAYLDALEARRRKTA